LDGLSQVVKDRLAARAGAHVVLGIRPEHLHLSPLAESSAGMKVR